MTHVSEEAALDEVLRNFVTGNNHMMIAHRPDASSYTEGSIETASISGLITLEDVMETLIQVYSGSYSPCSVILPLEIADMG